MYLGRVVVWDAVSLSWGILEVRPNRLGNPLDSPMNKGLVQMAHRKLWVEMLIKPFWVHAMPIQIRPNL